MRYEPMYSHDALRLFCCAHLVTLHQARVPDVLTNLSLLITGRVQHPIKPAASDIVTRLAALVAREGRLQLVRIAMCVL